MNEQRREKAVAEFQTLPKLNITEVSRSIRFDSREKNLSSRSARFAMGSSVERRLGDAVSWFHA